MDLVEIPIEFSFTGQHITNLLAQHFYTKEIATKYLEEHPVSEVDIGKFKSLNTFNKDKVISYLKSCYHNETPSPLFQFTKYKQVRIEDNDLYTCLQKNAELTQININQYIICLILLYYAHPEFYVCFRRSVDKLFYVKEFKLRLRRNINPVPTGPDFECVEEVLSKDINSNAWGGKN